ncbi:opioid growth factor receptor-like isoform X1 [Nelusetta ayraudi]|uniref:opioid growth factor receptor-like isoform X1 n=1 Tax=Nelusetta ayraudi TaxID=303726 RepID=UPI003F6FA80B
MALFIYHRLCRLWDCVWRGFFFVHRVFSPRFRSLVDYVRLEVGGGSRDAPSTETAGGLQGVDTEREWSPEQGSEKKPPPGGHSARVTDEEGEAEAVDDDRLKTTDEFYCSYDSTWETEEGAHDERASRPLTSFRSNKFKRFESAARDMQNYRRGYPKKLQWWKRPGSNEMPNLNFYLRKAQSQPDGALITDFHEQWFGNYDDLEHVHTYIQWLFPLQEPGVNSEAAPLTKEEIECFLASPTAKGYLFKSYVLMLDFYGIKLSDEKTGEVKRSSNWEERFSNLNTRTHNNLRITRILKCLGTLGFPQYQAPLVHFFLTETLVHGRLPNVKDSVLSYFVFAVLDKHSRRDLIKFAFLRYDRNEEFVWCPKKLQRQWAREAAERKST